jgi:hypothetical protein
MPMPALARSASPVLIEGWRCPLQHPQWLRSRSESGYLVTLQARPWRADLEGGADLTRGRRATRTPQVRSGGNLPYLPSPAASCSRYSHNTFTGSETAGRCFAMFTLATWVRRIEAEFARSVFPAGGHYELELDLSGFLRGDPRPNGRRTPSRSPTMCSTRTRCGRLKAGTPGGRRNDEADHLAVISAADAGRG